MAINACTINSFTIDGGRCRNRFNGLVNILHPIVGTNPRVLRDNYPQHRPFEIEDEKQLTFEQPIVTVSVEFYGSSGTETQDISTAQLDFVTVTDFKVEGINNASDISVSISDFKFE